MATKKDEKMPWIEAIMQAIRDKDMEAPRPGQKDEYGNDMYSGEVHDGLASFDSELDSGQYPTVHWLIARYMLRDASEYVMMTQLQFYQGMIQRNLDAAIIRMMDTGTPVYRIIENGGSGRNISCLTLREWYKDAKAANFQRLQKRIKSGIWSVLDRAEGANPEGLNGLVDYAVAIAESRRKGAGDNNGQGEAAGNFNALSAGREMSQGYLSGSM